MSTVCNPYIVPSSVQNTTKAYFLRILNWEIENFPIIYKAQYHSPARSHMHTHIRPGLCSSFKLSSISILSLIGLLFSISLDVHWCCIGRRGGGGNDRRPSSPLGYAVLCKLHAGLMQALLLLLLAPLRAVVILLRRVLWGRQEHAPPLREMHERHRQRVLEHVSRKTFVKHFIWSSNTRRIKSSTWSRCPKESWYDVVCNCIIACQKP